MTSRWPTPWPMAAAVRCSSAPCGTDQMSSAYEIGGNDGVPYVPVEEIPIEWRPPEFSPRLLSWAPLPVGPFFQIALGLGKET
jgi:hypothetical protein